MGGASESVLRRGDDRASDVAARGSTPRRAARRLVVLLVVAAMLASGLVAVVAVAVPAPVARAAVTGQDCNLPHDTTWGSTCDAYWDGRKVGTLTADKYNPQVGERVRLTVRVDYPPVQLLLWEFDPLDSIPHLVGNNVGTNVVVLRFPGGKLVDWGQPPSAVRSDQVQNLSYISWSMNLNYNNCATAGTLVAHPERPACGIEPGAELWAEFEVLPHAAIPLNWWEGITAAESPFVGARTASVWFSANTPELGPDERCPEQCVTTRFYSAFRYPGPGLAFTFWPQPGDPRASVYLLEPAIEGTVRDAKGRPLPDRGLRIYKKAQSSDDPCAASPGQAPLAAPSTNINGQYRVVFDDPAEYQVCPYDTYAMTPQSVNASNEFIETAIADFRFDGFRLSGQVTQNESGVCDAVIDITASPPDASNPPRTAFTNCDGMYEIWLKRGVYDVTASADVEECGEEECTTTHFEGRPEHVVIDMTNDDGFADFTLGENAKLSLEVDGPEIGAVGDLIEYTVLLTNDGTGPVDLDSVDVTVPDDGGTGFALVDGPVPDLPSQIPPGQTASAVYRFRADATGTPVVGFAASGHAGETPVSDSREVRLTIGNPLKVEINISEEDQKVALTLPQREGDPNQGLFGWTDPGPGEVTFDPKTVTAKVKVTNQTNQTARGLTLLGPSADAGLQLRVVEHVMENGVDTVRALPQPTPFPLEVATPHPQWQIGDLAPGEDAELVFKLVVKNGATFEIAALVHGANDSGDLTGDARAEIEATTDIELLVEAGIPMTYGQHPKVDEGQSYPVWGIVKNLSATDTIRIDPLVPVTKWNAGALMTFESSAGAPAPGDDGRVETFIGKTLAPGETLWWTAIIETAEFPRGIQTGIPTSGLVPTRSEVRLAPMAHVVDSDGTETDLDASKLRVDLGNGTVVDESPSAGGAKLLRVQVEERLDVPPLRDLVDDLIYAFGTATTNLISGAAHGFVAVFQLAYQLAQFNVELLSRPDKTILRAIQVSTYLGNAYRALQGVDWANLVSSVWPKLVDAGFAITDPQNWTFEVLTSWFEQMDQAAESGNTTQLIDVWGRGFRPLGEVVGNELAAAAAVRLASSMLLRDPSYLAKVRAADEEAKLAEQAKIEAAATENAAAGDPLSHDPVPAIKEIDPALVGNLSDAQVSKFSGLPQRLIRGLRDATRELPVLIGLDTLPEYILKWVDDALEAVWKPEWMKAKSVSPQEAEVLGYRVGSGGPLDVGYGKGDAGSLVFGEPLPPRLADSRIGDDATARKWLNDRIKEWNSSDPESGVQGLMKGLTDEVLADGTTVRRTIRRVPKRGLNPDANIDLNGAAVEYELRVVEYRRLPPERTPLNNEFKAETGRDREYWEVWIETEAGSGKFARVVSDPDPLLAIGLDGQALGREAMQQLADWLQSLGIQHPWTMTWENLQKAKEILSKYLWEVAPGVRGKPMQMFADGKAGLGWLDSVDWLDALHAGNPVHIRLRGAPEIWGRGTIDIPATPRPAPPALPGPTTYVNPIEGFRALAALGDGGAPPAIAATAFAATAAAANVPCADHFTNAPGALALRVNDDLSFDRWTPSSGWQPTTLKEDCRSGTVTSVAVLPQTVLRNGAAAGAQELDVLTLEQLLPGVESDWFAVGDTVVVNPGGDNEEQGVITGLAPLTLLQPLQHAHDAREPVLLVALNHAPTCAGIDGSVDAGASTTIAPACDDPDDDDLTFTIAAAPTTGTAAVAGGQITYTAPAGASGVVTFTYSASDGHVTSEPATVSIDVTPARSGADLSVSKVRVVPAAGKAKATLDADGVLTSSGITCGQDVVMKLGAWQETIAGRNFEARHDRCEYKVPKKRGGFVTKLTIRTRTGDWDVKGEGDEVDFGPLTGSVPVQLSVGAVSGNTTVTFTRHGKTWAYPR